MRGDEGRTLELLRGSGSLRSSDLIRDPASAGLAYDYLATRLKRQGLAPGVPIVNMVRAAFSRGRSFGSGFALFTRLPFYAGGGVILYGDDEPPLDIVAHEIAHGVIDYSSRLIYRGEAGALQEAFADIFATAVEFEHQPAGAGRFQADYLIGEDAVSPASVRSLRDPVSGGQVDHYQRRFRGTAGTGDMYANAGIAAHAFYLAIEGGNHPLSQMAVTGVGSAHRHAVERVFYRAFAFMLPANATFALAREATLQAARDLAGDGSAVEHALRQAWDAVGIP
jgi:Zn-dependent metalloprotease